jgi:hypothetical protein
MRTPNLQSQKGATLVEAMIGFTIAMMGIAFFLSIYVGGLRMLKFHSIRFQAASEATTVTTKIGLEMRCAYTNEIGRLTGTTASSFVASTNQNASGNAMRIYPTAFLTNWICYYYVPASNALYRADSSGAVRTMAHSVTSSISLFSFPTFSGEVVGMQHNLMTINLRFFTTNQQTRKLFLDTNNILTYTTIAVPRKI